MGHSQADKARTHQRILAAASRSFRRNGLDGIGLADLMQEAGATVGGFYKHFESREALVAAAVQAAFGGWERRIEEGGKAGQPAEFADVVDGYLNERHKKDPARGCPIAALSSDLGRSGHATRALTTAQLKRNIELLASTLPAGEARRDTAMLAYCAMVGAMNLARISDDEDFSKEILDVTAKTLKRRAGPAKRTARARPASSQISNCMGKAKP
jgi:TetR/AcrR family transcriptional repressor of nem operon